MLVLRYTVGLFDLRLPLSLYDQLESTISLFVTPLHPSVRRSHECHHLNFDLQIFCDKEWQNLEVQPRWGPALILLIFEREIRVIFFFSRQTSLASYEIAPEWGRKHPTLLNLSQYLDREVVQITNVTRPSTLVGPSCKTNQSQSDCSPCSI